MFPRLSESPASGKHGTRRRWHRLAVLLLTTVAAVVVLMASTISQSSRLLPSANLMSWTGPRAYSPLGCEALASTVSTRATCSDLKDLDESYTVHRALSEGLQAAVADVSHNGNGQHYIARFPARLVGNDDAFKFGRLLCGAPHVAQLVDFGCHTGVTLKDYLAAQKQQGDNPDDNNAKNFVSIFEKCRGVSLGTLFPNEGCTTLTYDEIRSIIRQLLEALAAIQEKGIIHRDIGYSNIMHDRDSGKICIIDFGLAKMLPEWIVSTPPEEIDEAELERYGYNITIKDAIDYIKIEYNDDILTVAGIVAKMLSLPIPWRPQKDNHEVFARQVLTMLGSHDLQQLEKKYEWFKLPPKIAAQLRSVPAERADWRKKYTNPCNEKFLTDEALSFVDGLLQYSYVARRNFFLAAHTQPFLQP